MKQHQSTLNNRFAIQSYLKSVAHLSIAHCSLALQTAHLPLELNFDTSELKALFSSSLISPEQAHWAVPACVSKACQCSTQNKPTEPYQWVCQQALQCSTQNKPTFYLNSYLLELVLTWNRIYCSWCFSLYCSWYWHCFRMKFWPLCQALKSVSARRGMFESGIVIIRAVIAAVRSTVVERVRGGRDPHTQLSAPDQHLCLNHSTLGSLPRRRLKKKQGPPRFIKIASI